MALALLFFMAGTALGSQEQLMEGAKKEGKLVLYTAMQPEDSDRLLRLYRSRYPFIDATYFRAGSAPLLNRILSEIQARKHLFDAVSGKVSDLLFLKKKGVLAKLVSEELRYYDPRFKDPEGYYVDIYSNYYTIAYHRTHVRPDEVPTRWDDLLEPKWSGGKIALDPRSYDWYFGMLTALGAKNGKAFVKRLSQNKPTFREGNVLVTNLLAAGEFPLAITYAHLVERLRAKGAPVDWASLSPMIAVPISIALPQRSPHPNAAQLFRDLVLSKEGADLLKDMGRVPTRNDVAPSAKRLDPKNLHLVPLHVSSDEIDAKEFRKIFGLD